MNEELLNQFSFYTEEMVKIEFEETANEFSGENSQEPAVTNLNHYENEMILLKNNLEDKQNELDQHKRILDHKLSLAAGEKESAFSNMKKLHICLKDEKKKNKEMEELLQKERKKVKSLGMELTEMKEKLVASEQSIRNLREQHNLMSDSCSSEINLKNEILLLKKQLQSANKTQQTLTLAETSKGVIYHSYFKMIEISRNPYLTHRRKIRGRSFQLSRTSPDNYVIITEEETIAEFSVLGHQHKRTMMRDSKNIQLIYFNVMISKGTENILEINFTVEDTKKIKSLQDIFKSIFKDNSATSVSVQSHHCLAAQTTTTKQAATSTATSNNDKEIFGASVRDFYVSGKCSEKQGRFELHKRTNEFFICFSSNGQNEYLFNFNAKSFKKIFISNSTYFCIYFRSKESIEITEIRGRFSLSKTCQRLEKIIDPLLESDKTLVHKAVRKHILEPNNILNANNKYAKLDGQSGPRRTLSSLFSDE